MAYTEMVDSLKQTVLKSYRQLDDVFTDTEAWVLFKASAILETVGWTLLITGIIFKYFKWPLHDWVLPLAGSFHGIFVIGYMLIVFFAHRSLRWNFTQFLVAEFVSIIPFGALVFEWRMAYLRKNSRQDELPEDAIAVAADSRGLDGFQSQ